MGEKFVSKNSSIESTAKNSKFVSLQTVLDSGQKLTPMMEQYSEVKINYPDTIVFFRMGDFYELFFEDAVRASQLLSITLTHRGKVGDFKIPMAGIPHHAASTYVDRLSSQGIKVAIAEQVEDPKEAKGIVKRAVTQIVSPGMPFDLDRSDSKSHFFMASFVKYNNGPFYLVLLDYTTGEFIGHSLSDKESLFEKLKNYSPKELIVYPGQLSKETQELADQMGSTITRVPEELFDIENTEIYLDKILPGFKKDKILKTHGDIHDALGALAYYVCSTQKLENFYHIRPFKMISDDEFLGVSDNTLKGIEILPRSKETWNISLLAHMNKTKTAIGLRTLKRLFMEPLKNLKRIQERQETIKFLFANPDLMEEVREILLEVRDIERIVAKTTTQKINAGDFLNLANSIKAYKDLEKVLPLTKLRAISKLSKKELTVLEELSNSIVKTINDEVGATLEKGNLIKKGANKKRDRLAGLLNQSADKIVELENKYKKLCGINNLRIKHNNVFGYFIEISKGQSKNAHKSFVKKQTLVNCERYMTPELEELEKELVTAKDKLQTLEREIYRDLIDQVVQHTSALGNLSSVLGMIDSFQSLAWTAYKEEFIQPEIQDKNQVFEVTQAWHPLIKKNLNELFVPHDISLNSKKYFGLITGPNMAGKTTVMREMAIIQFLAQIGSFVPAKKAKLGVCDYLFSRLGASDDIVNGQSTFMVEMSETATILRHATEKSFIILDEVGRGTSTYDGLSIAWALVENFVKNTKALCLFSTHYHELIELADELDHAQNFTVETINNDGDVKFLYRLLEEAASQSYGVHVAKLAGLPPLILHRSEEILRGLETDTPKKEIAPTVSNQDYQDQLSIFNFDTSSLTTGEEAALEDLKSIDLLNLTPIKALLKLEELVNGVKGVNPDKKSGKDDHLLI